MYELNCLNKFFQGEDVVTHLVKREIEKRYKNIVGIFISRSYVRKTGASDINIFDVDNYLKFNDFFISEGVTYELAVQNFFI